MKIKLNFSILIFVLFYFVQSCSDDVKPSESDKVLYTNDIISIRTKHTGIPENVRTVYIIPFSDLTGKKINLNDFENRIVQEFGKAGIRVLKQMNKSDAVLTGNLETLDIRSSEATGTNLGVIYSLTCSYTIGLKNLSWSRKDETILERILVMNTNAFPEDKVLPVLTENASAHLAESVLYGWQLVYSQTGKNILTLGGTLETNSSTNRTQSDR